jgi:uncharacterized membrane protein YdjX (TVP38/TMEM64 family)
MILIAVATGIYLLGTQVLDVISFKTIGLNYALFKNNVAAHYTQSVLLYLAAYAALGAFVLPGSALLVVASGLLFGATVGIPLAVLASTLAASLGFLGARSIFGQRLTHLSNPLFQTLRQGFARNAVSYMLFLRLTPGLPFALINIGPGLIGIPFRTFLLGTALGVLPSRIALSTAGAGLGKAIETQNLVYSQCVASRTADSLPCTYDIQVASLLTKETLAAFVALAFLALIPAMMDAAPHLWQRLKAR